MLRRINFPDISIDELRSSVDRHLADANLPETFLTKVLTMKDDVENASSGVDSCDNAAVDAKSKGIINFRGMELAMVKVIHLSPFITTHVHMTFIRQYSLYADLLFESIGFDQTSKSLIF